MKGYIKKKKQTNQKTTEHKYFIVGGKKLPFQKTFLRKVIKLQY